VTRREGDLDRLREMAAHGRAMRGLVKDLAYRDFAADDRLPAAVLDHLSAFAEASLDVPEPVKAALPGIPWTELQRLRHRIARGRDALDPSMVYLTAAHRVATLVRIVSRFLAGDR